MMIKKKADIWIKITLGSMLVLLVVLVSPSITAASPPSDPTQPLPFSTTSPPYCDEWHSEYPAVVQVGSTYFAYYSGYGCKWQIYYATSSDGIHFNKQGPISIDDGWATQRAFPFVLYQNGLFRLYYGGGYPYQVGYAESHDGVHFIAQPQPILPTEANEWDDVQTLRPSVVEVEEPGEDLVQKLGLTTTPAQLYLMYYNGFGDADSAVGLAYSNDGLSWQRYTGNPIITSTTGIYTSFAIREAGTTYLYYHTGTDLYLMTSKNGVDFTPYSADPVLHIGNPGTWNAGLVYGAFVRRTDAGDYVMYFNGIPGKDAPYGMVGIATSPDLIHFTQSAANPVITVGNTPANFEAHANADGSITASWHDVVSDTTSYRLSYGQQSKLYTTSIDVTSSNSFTFTPEGSGDYYLSVTALSAAQRAYPAEERVVHLPLAAAAVSTPSPRNTNSLRGIASLSVLLVALAALAETLVARQWLRQIVRRRANLGHRFNSAKWRKLPAATQ